MKGTFNVLTKMLHNNWLRNNIHDFAFGVDNLENQRKSDETRRSNSSWNCSMR
jgi:hypothetical protein